MRSLPRPAVLAGALLFLGAPLAAQGRSVPGTAGYETGGARGAYQAQVALQMEQLLMQWRDAWTSDDARALSGLHDDDAVVMTPEGSALRGRGEIREHFARALAGLGNVQTTRVDFGTSGDLAYEVGQYSYETGADGSGGVRSGSYLLVARREWDRGWVIQSLSLSDAAHPTD